MGIGAKVSHAEKLGADPNLPPILEFEVSDCRADTTDEEPPRQQNWLAAVPDAAGNGAALAIASKDVLDPTGVELFEERDSNADHDMIPVQPMETPSVPPLMSHPNLSDMSQAELFNYSMQIWNWKQNDQLPIAHLPNRTQEAHKIKQRANSPSPRRLPDSSVASSPSSVISTKQML